MSNVNLIKKGCLINTAGNKAKYLSKAKNIGITIPKTIVIDAPKYWNSNDGENYILNLAYAEVARQFIDTPLMVRSSCDSEDTMNNSNAGMFLSVQISSIAQLKNAIKEVWHSAGKFVSEMGVIIQPFIKTEISGIAFSSYGFSDDIVIEYVKGPCSLLTSGKCNPIIYERKKFSNNNNNTINHEILLETINTISKLKSAFNFEVDIEFCIDTNKTELILLQCRPITAKRNRFCKYFNDCKGEWMLYDEMPYPFLPLIISLDPTGMFDKTNTKFINYHVYFKKGLNQSLDNSINYKNYEGRINNWEKTKSHYIELFTSYIDNQNVNIDTLMKIIKDYREFVGFYMDSGWFAYRRKIYLNLVDELKNYGIEKPELFILNSVANLDTINSRKRKEFNNLIKHHSSKSFKILKKEFLKKYGFESSYPFYINRPTLSEQFENIIKFAIAHYNQSLSKEPLLKRDSFLDNLENEQIKALLTKYRQIIMITEDDDYILSYGSYCIKKIIDEISHKFQIKDIYFFTYAELTEYINGSDRLLINKVADRKKEYNIKSNYIMPFLIKDGVGIYDQNKKTLHLNRDITGKVVSPGISKGYIYHLKNPDDILEIMSISNESIVCLKSISPIISSFFSNIKGLIISETSILSHGAILARERNVPAISGVDISLLKDGQYVRLDAIEGLIQIIN